MGKELESAIVTTGGTKEPLDSVRFITNFSTGRFGYAIAQALADRGYKVTVLCPREVPLLAGGEITARHRNFTDTESLRVALMGEEGPAIVFHAAAVSDYRPKRVAEGKIPSSAETLVIELERTPKILAGLREKYGQESYLVGFKLLSGVPRNELVRAALEQNRKNHLNLTVANDLQNLRGGLHPVILVTAEGGAIDLMGTREEVAKNLVEFVRKRSQVQWYRTQEATGVFKVLPEEKEKFAQALQFAQETHLLYDASGNVSRRCGENLMMVTPRQVDKSKITLEEACVASVDHENNRIFYQGRTKSSIDTAVADFLYHHLPKINYLLHFHNQWGTADHTSSFPYPCGVKEEALEILRQLDKGGQDEFAIELLHHGFLLGLPEGGIERLQKEWEVNLEEFREHLLDAKMAEPAEEAVLKGKAVLKPAFADTHIVGVVMERPAGAVAYLSQAARGKGVGRKIVEQFTERQIPIQTIDECGVLEFYEKFGFRGDKDQETGIYTLHPPKIVESDRLFKRVEEWKLAFY